MAMEATPETAASAGDDGGAVSIMREVHALYTRADDGLVALARSVGLRALHAPRRKVNVLVLGNHSAGKSSFINWYIDDDVQRTGVAIETQGFTIVTSGSRRTLAPIKGESSVLLYPYLEPIKARFGKPLLENLSTSVSTSTARDFAMVDFIDSPGLVDGDIAYPFDVNDALVAFAACADLVFVFLDPMGQALCSRTMSVVQQLSRVHHDKIKYYLTKADTVPNQTELMKLMVQITQNIQQYIQNQHGLEIPAVWLPSRGSRSGASTPTLRVSSRAAPSMPEDVNQIGDLLATIEKAIHQKVQDNLSHVEKDCAEILERTHAVLAQDELEIAAKKSREFVAVFFSVCAWTIPVVTFLTLVGEFEHLLPAAIRDAEFVMSLVRTMYDGVRPILFGGASAIGGFAMVKLFGISVVLFLIFNGTSKFTHARARKFVPQPRDVINKWRSHEQILREIGYRRQELFLEYVRAYTPVEDLRP